MLPTTLRGSIVYNGCEDIPRTAKVIQMSDDVKMCNCARCQVDLLGADNESWYMKITPRQRELVPKLVAGRLYDRPYCQYCLRMINQGNEPPAPYNGKGQLYLKGNNN